MSEFIPGIVIEADTTRLQREAQALHRAWFAAPDSAAARERFAYALRAWGKAAGKQDAIAHADRLLQWEREAPAD